MALNYTGKVYGTITIKQRDQRFTLEIREANALCAIIHVRKATKEEKKKYGPDANYIHNLYTFFCDEAHAKNIAKSNGGKLFWDEVTSIKLNLFHKDSWKLLKLFTKYGYTVTCYQKES